MGEIEFHVKQFLSGLNVVCLPFENKSGIIEIAMFIEAKEFDTTELVSYMKSKMPNYMVPNKIIFVKEFPLNGNSKIDKKYLKGLIK
jgi:non-ribosomal peptide synthetase component E (peptide arylation enzyme)